MSTNVYVICIDCVNIHSIECIRNTSVDSVDIYSIWKALSLSFPKLFADWKSVEY